MAIAGFVLAAQAPATGELPVYGYQVVHTYPHDSNAFTQGLQYLDGVLYEGTGLNGRSSVRKVKLETGEVLNRFDVAAQHFGEGIVVFKSDLFELTWQSQIAFVYDKDTFQTKRQFTYPGEGWGLTHDGVNLIMSDGTDYLRILDPATFQLRRRVRVMDGERPLRNLNELEYVKGEVLANIWTTDYIARIDPRSGIVLGYINLEGILSANERPSDGVLNGIAYDAARDRLFVTGKLWPKLFEIRIVKK